MNMRKGFTLIELLIVIVIIGILAGVVLTVINPAQQRDKANIAVARANLDKVCLAMLACGSTSSSAASCVGYDAIGATDPTGTPAMATYTAPFVNGVGELEASVSVDLSGTAPNCVYRCTHDVANGDSTAVTADVPAECYNI
jgi:prepilin-type N-terminal cleavage/methylation domain-containing protein